jgi:hypothetical protein
MGFAMPQTPAPMPHGAGRTARAPERSTDALKAVTGDTGGRFSVMEHRLDARGPSPPTHVHDQLDHAVYVV